jgi:ATP-binding cassette, sub-family E, member 1
MKPQYVDQIPRVIKGEVEEMLKTNDQRKIRQELIVDLGIFFTHHTHRCVSMCLLFFADLAPVLKRQVSQLSGGELQRFAIAIACLQEADMYVKIFFLICADRFFRIDICLMNHRPTWTFVSV